MAGMLLFAGVAATDWVDGYVARRTNQVSELGKILDPVADRLAVGAGLIALMVRGALPLWAGLAVLVRDVAVLVVGAALLAGRGIRIDVRFLGKSATAHPHGRHHLHRLGQLRSAARGALPRRRLGAVRGRHRGVLRGRLVVPRRHPAGPRGHRTAAPRLTPARGGGFIAGIDTLRVADRGGTVEYPEDVRYTRQHEWARLEDGRVRVGITDYAQDALGDVVYVDLPESGTSLTADQPFGEVESTKSVSDVFAPIGGTVIGRNALLEEHPELVNEQPYGDGWLLVVEPAIPLRWRD